MPDNIRVALWLARTYIYIVFLVGVTYLIVKSIHTTEIGGLILAIVLAPVLIGCIFVYVAFEMRER